MGVLLFSVLSMSLEQIRWGPLTVKWTSLSFDDLNAVNWEQGDSVPTLRFYEGKKFLHEIEIYMATVDTQDLTGDGVPELIVQDYSGGAHCCFRFLVYTRVPILKLLGNFNMGNGNLDFEDIDADGVQEAVGTYDGLAYLDYPYVVSPFLPVVFKLENGVYVECTEKFPDLVESSLYDYLDFANSNIQLAQEDEPEALEELRKARAAGVMGHFLLLKDEASGWETIRKLDPEILPWLKDNMPAIREAVENMKNAVGYSDDAEDQE